MPPKAREFAGAESDGVDPSCGACLDPSVAISTSPHHVACGPCLSFLALASGPLMDLACHCLHVIRIIVPPQLV